MKIRRLLVKTLALMTSTALLTVLALPAAAETWDMPMAYPDNNFHTETGKVFAECVAEGSAGELELVIHGNGSLFSGSDIKRAVQTGQAPIGERLLSAHQNESAIFGVDSVPFMATGYEASVKLWEIAKPTLETVLDEQNLVLLYSVPWPPQGIYAKKEVNSAADMEGVKFRSYNNATARMAELMGAVPVQIEAAELSQALATGVAESFISSGSTGYDEKVWEHLTHWYATDAWLPRNYVFVNKDSWSGLSEGTQGVLKDCAATAEEAGTAKSMELAEWYKEQLSSNGMTVQPPGDTLKTDLLGIGETMTAEWLEAAGDQGQAIVDAFKAQ
ncbi:MAG: TRAP transporter substrate-binding protein [Pseudomonadota bacterium]